MPIATQRNFAPTSIGARRLWGADQIEAPGQISAGSRGVLAIANKVTAVGKAMNGEQLCVHYSTFFESWDYGNRGGHASGRRRLGFL